MTGFSAVIPLYLAKVVKHNKSNTVFLHDIFVIVSSFYLSEITYVIRGKNFELIPDAAVTPRIYKSCQGKTICTALVNNRPFK